MSSVQTRSLQRRHSRVVATVLLFFLNIIFKLFFKFQIIHIFITHGLAQLIYFSFSSIVFICFDRRLRFGPRYFEIYFMHLIYLAIF